MNELQLHCMLLVSYIQQYFNTSITVLTNQVWKLLSALFKVPNTGAFTVSQNQMNSLLEHYEFPLLETRLTWPTGLSFSKFLNRDHQIKTARLWDYQAARKKSWSGAEQGTSALLIFLFAGWIIRRLLLYQPSKRWQWKVAVSPNCLLNCG